MMRFNWTVLTQFSAAGHFLVPVSEGGKYGFDKSRHVIMPEEVVGQESYIVSLDVMHHLHCLVSSSTPQSANQAYDNC